MQQNFKKEVLNKYNQLGALKFYEYLLESAYKQILLVSCSYTLLLKDINWRGKSPDQEYFSCYEDFLIAYRREGNILYFNIAEIFRRAANKIYRHLLSKRLITKNKKYFNIIK